MRRIGKALDQVKPPLGMGRAVEADEDPARAIRNTGVRTNCDDRSVEQPDQFEEHTPDEQLTHRTGVVDAEADDVVR